MSSIQIIQTKFTIWNFQTFVICLYNRIKLKIQHKILAKCKKLVLYNFTITKYRCCLHFNPLSLSLLGTFRALQLVNADQTGYISVSFILQNLFTLQTSNKASLDKIDCASAKRLVNSTSVQPYNCSIHCVCAVSLDENAIARSIWQEGAHNCQVSDISLYEQKLAS